MLKWIIAFFVLCSVVGQASLALPHYPILIGDRSPIITKRGEMIELTYGRGHLNTAKWTDAPEPDWIRAYTFDGMFSDLKPSLRSTGPTKKLKYKVKRLGDTWIVFHIPRQWSDHDLAWTETWVRTIVHYELSRGWDEPLGLPVEIVPLNRPYGILSGDAFNVQVLHDGMPLSGINIYAEKYYESPLKKPYPPDAILTRVARTDSTGTATLTLRSPGWWILFVTYEKGKLAKDNKEGPVFFQDALWVYVEEVK